MKCLKMSLTFDRMCIILPLVQKSSKSRLKEIENQNDTIIFSCFLKTILISHNDKSVKIEFYL